jgi:hypothetical protein
VICKSCGMGAPDGATRCTNCGASLVGQPQGITQHDVFLGTFKALLLMAVLSGALALITLGVLWGIGVIGQ